MTCIEKLRELHPEWSEYKIQKAIECDCPHDHVEIGVADCDSEELSCDECWAREVGGDCIPSEFEYFDDVYPFRAKRRRFVSVLEKIEHRYTRNPIYKILVFIPDGDAYEKYTSESELLKLLAMRVGGECDVTKSK